MWQPLHAEHTALAGDRWFGIRHRRSPSYDVQLGDSQERDRLHEFVLMVLVVPPAAGAFETSRIVP
jgi:hypothetical protein